MDGDEADQLRQPDRHNQLKAASSWLLFLGPPLLLHLLLPLPCPMLAATGFECPGCGGTRAIRALGAGNLVGSIDFNAAVVAGPLAFAIYFAIASSRRDRASSRLGGYRLLMTGLILWGVLRNLPGLEALLASG